MSDNEGTNFFGQNGLLSQHLDGYEERPSQVKYAKAVDKAIRQERNLIIEAGTGTGKSFSYLVPAIANRGECRTVVATANIALQEQLVKKDLPFLEKVLPVNFTFGLAKGRNNYLCKNQLDHKSKQKEMFDNDPIEKTIKEWAAKTKTGDKIELAVEPPADTWRQYSVTANECIKCSYAKEGECYAENAKAELASKDIIVCNYHLLCANTRLKIDTGKDLVLPSFNVLICDEGHRFADIGRGFFGWEISEHVIQRLCREILGLVKHAEKGNQDSKLDEIKAFVDGLRKAADKFFKRLEQFHGIERGGKRIHKKNAFKIDSMVRNLEGVGDGFIYLKTMVGEVYKKQTDIDNAKAKCQKEKKRCFELIDELRDANELEDTESVYYTDHVGRSKLIKIVKRRIEVGDILWQYLFEPLRSTIVTSATLDSGDNFAYMRKELGLKSAEKMMVASPFNFQKQCLFVLPREASNPQDKEFGNKIGPVIQKVIQESDGRTLCLFTSYRNLNLAKEYLLAKNNGYNIFCQGDLPRTMLVEKFREDINSVLLGTESFWSGVDVPGEALSCVVIDKLPFRSPGDPVWDELCDRSENWFWELSLPAAIIQFKQGAGRLIRRASDRGVIVVLDERLVTKRYGDTFIDSLPGMNRSRLLNHVGDFLEGKLKI